MAYDEGLAERVREQLADERDITERPMFGGLSFLRGGKMFVGIWHDDLLVRVGVDAFDAAVKLPHARPMEFSNKDMKLPGFVLVSPEGVDFDADLASWIARGKVAPPKPPKVAKPKAAKTKPAKVVAKAKPAKVVAKAKPAKVKRR
jgi:TfoX/Sxy family transcriptional regulator of competence genes